MKRGVLIYIGTIVLAACVLLGLGIQSFQRQRQVVETLTAEKLAAEVAKRTHEAAATAYVDHTHPVARFYFEIENGEVVSPAVHAALSEALPEKFVEANWPAVCRRPDTEGLLPSGAIFVLDLQRIESDLTKSVVATLPAGCSTRRIAVSPDGNALYATATFEDILMVFDLKPLKSGGTPALMGKVPTGHSPIGITLIQKGTQIVVANTNLVSSGDDAKPGEQTLTVFDAARIAEGARAVLGTIPTKTGPRNLSVTADGKTLFVNSASPSLQIIDLERVKVEPVKK